MFEFLGADGVCDVEFSDEVKLDAGDVIKSVVFVLYNKLGGKVVLNGVVTVDAGNKNKIQLRIKEGGYDKHIKDAANKKNISYIGVALKPAKSLISEYNTGSDWVYPIEFRRDAISRISGLVGIKNIRYSVQRHSLYGEIPDFRLYKIINKSEYEIAN